MKLHILHDRDGRIQAATVASDEKDSLVCKPIAGEGMIAAELDLAAEHRDMALDVLCTRFRVDTKNKRPRLVAGGGSAA